MNPRLQATALLLATVLDAPFAQPKTWTGELVARNAKRGEVPSTRIPCPACGGDKRRRVRTVVVDCDRCLGAKGKPLGYIVVDGMIDERYRRRIGTLATGLELQLKLVGCDVCGGKGETLAPRWRGEHDRCLRCGGGGHLELHLSAWRATRFAAARAAAPRSGDPVLDSMEAREQAGSYDELLLALAELHQAWPSLYRLVLERYVAGKRLGSERLERLAEEGGLAFLAARMPDEIRVPGSARRRQEAAA